MRTNVTLPSNLTERETVQYVLQTVFLMKESLREQYTRGIEFYNESTLIEAMQLCEIHDGFVPFMQYLDQQRLESVFIQYSADQFGNEVFKVQVQDAEKGDKTNSKWLAFRCEFEGKMRRFLGNSRVTWNEER